jgi:hypothetical protein
MEAAIADRRQWARVLICHNTQIPPNTSAHYDTMQAARERWSVSESMRALFSVTWCMNYLWLVAGEDSWNSTALLPPIRPLERDDRNACSWETPDGGPTESPEGEQCETSRARTGAERTRAETASADR